MNSSLVASRVALSISDAGYTTADVAEWLSQPITTVESKLRGDTQLDVLDLIVTARNIGKTTSAWMAELGL